MERLVWLAVRWFVAPFLDRTLGPHWVRLQADERRSRLVGFSLVGVLVVLLFLCTVLDAAFGT